MHRPTVGAQLLHQLDEYPAADQSLFEGHRGVTGGSQGGHRGVALPLATPASELSASTTSFDSSCIWYVSSFMQWRKSRL